MKQAGFTLIELSIVLVIIGLLAAGVLVGKDLIAAAQMRAQVRQLQQFDLAVNTFRIKYNAIPGDMRADQAVEVGFTVRAGTDSHGDGDGMVESCNDSSGIGSLITLGCERLLFWSDLSKAKLITGDYSAATDGYMVLTLANFQKDLFNYMPMSPLKGNVAIFTAHCEPSSSWFTLAKYLVGVAGSVYTPNATAGGLTGFENYSLDAKMDDGKPLSGIVQAKIVTGASLSTYYCEPPVPGPNACVTLAGEYNLDPAVLDCQLLNVKMSSMP